MIIIIFIPIMLGKGNNNYHSHNYNSHQSTHNDPNYSSHHYDHQYGDQSDGNYHNDPIPEVEERTEFVPPAQMRGEITLNLQNLNLQDNMRYQHYLNLYQPQHE